MIVDAPRILITDDDVQFRETLSSVLEPHGFRTFQAGDGEEALDFLRRQDVHLLLLDMHMPRLTGLETLRRVQQFRAGLPCILLSAEADEQLVSQALSAAAFAVLRKPVTRGHILDNVDRALRRVYDWPVGDRGKRG